ncbi:MAG: hypothetical protein L6Q98_19890 [Anaerolineae bacterium]|nr:hypothetical protein [Anaerolineae bacterium]NUQ06721.1 hypothetical protein [Anaerolineae bacterium]
MAIYRVLRPLSGRGRIDRGELTRLDWLPEANIAILLRVGAIARVSPPALDALPGWEMVAVLLAPLGITDGEQLVEAVFDRLAEVVEGTGADEMDVRRWQGDMIALMRGKQNKGCGCRPA